MDGSDSESNATHSGRNTSSKEPSEDGEVDKSALLSAKSKDVEDLALPEKDAPPLPEEAPPAEDDGWAALWDENAQAFYFYNRYTQASQWTNPRIPDPTTQPGPPGIANHDRMGGPPPGLPSAAPAQLNSTEAQADYTGYNPAIHGDYDPTAPYAQPQRSADMPYDSSSHSAQAPLDPENPYAATGTFNRFTGKWQAANLNPELHNDENKSRRQMSAFFDVDAAANSHNGKSLKAERAGKKLSKQELKAFKVKKRERKEEKRRAWLRD